MQLSTHVLRWTENIKPLPLMIIDGNSKRKTQQISEALFLDGWASCFQESPWSTAVRNKLTLHTHQVPHGFMAAHSGNSTTDRTAWAGSIIYLRYGSLDRVHTLTLTPHLTCIITYRNIPDALYRLIQTLPERTTAYGIAEL